MSDPQSHAPRLPPTYGERVTVALLLLTLLGLFLADLVRGGDPRALVVVFLFAAWAPLLVVHELGHALAAWSVGWRVSEIVLGHGRELARFQVGGTLVRLKPIPVEGYILPAPRGVRGGRWDARWKSAWVYLGGPLAEMLVVGVLWLVSRGRLFERATDTTTLALQGVALAAAVSLFFNLLPLPRAGQANDGLGILLSLRRDQASLTQWALSSVLTAVRRCLLADDVAGALRRLEAARAEHPDDPRLPAWTGVCLEAQGDHTAAEALIGGIGDPRRHGAHLAPELHAAKAWAWSLAEDRQLLTMARGEAMHARTGAPGELHFTLLLGRIELERGAPRVAYGLLMEAYRQARELDDEGPCLAFLALAAHRAGPSDPDDPPPVIRPDYVPRFVAALARLPVSAALRSRVREAVQGESLRSRP